MEFMRKSVGQLISIMDLPFLLCRPTHRSMGNPQILKTEIHPCRHPFTRWS